MSWRLPPLIRWPGGQSREVKKLERFFPEHDTYVEPFSGGASFFFGKDQAETEVLGDTSPWLMKFYDQVRKGGLRRCRIRYSKAAHRKALRGRTACDRMAVSALGFGGYLGKESLQRRNLPSGAPLYTQKLKKAPIYEARLRHAYLTTGDFERTMKSFDGKGTFHLLDPPWPENHSKEYYGNDDSEVTPADVARVCSKMKGTVWVLYNVHPAVLEAFRGRPFKIHKIRTVKNHPRRGARRGVKLLITNRALRRGR